MKKILGVILIACLAMALTACSSGVSQEEYDRVVAERDALAQEKEVLETRVESLSDTNAWLIGEVARLKEESLIEEESKNTAPKSENESENKDEDSTVLLYSDSNVEIRFSHCEKKYSFSDEWDFVFFVENKTAAAITIGTNYLSADGKSFSDAFGFEEIAPKSTGKFCVSTEEYEKKGFINKLSGSFYVADRGEKLGWENMLYDVEFSFG